jgi:hypothetical protein
MPPTLFANIPGESSMSASSVALASRHALMCCPIQLPQGALWQRLRSATREGRTDDQL